MQIGFHRFHADNIEWPRATVDEDGCTRYRLARELCEREEWRNEKGALCLASVRRVLPKLAGKLGIALLPAGEPVPQDAPARDFPDLSLRCCLAEVGEVALEPVSGSANRQRNNNRFLVLPGVRGLSLRVLDLAVTQLPGDWEAAYGVRPLTTYTYVSSDYSGAYYREVGWERCDRPTSGLPPDAVERGIA